MGENNIWISKGYYRNLNLSMREPVILLQFLAKLIQIEVKLGNDIDDK